MSFVQPTDIEKEKSHWAKQENLENTPKSSPTDQPKDKDKENNNEAIRHDMPWFIAEHTCEIFENSDNWEPQVIAIIRRIQTRFIFLIRITSQQNQRNWGEDVWASIPCQLGPPSPFYNLLIPPSLLPVSIRNLPIDQLNIIIITTLGKFWYVSWRLRSAE